MKTFFLPLLILLAIICPSLNGQVIPQDRRPDWSQAGFQGLIPQPARIINIVSFASLKDSLVDMAPSVQAAIDSLNGRSGVIYFPAGTYLIGEQLSVPDSVVLRGASSDSTTLIFNLQGQPVNGIDVSQPNQDSNFTSVTAGYTRGSNMITVADPSPFAANEWAEMVEDNGSWDVVPVSYSVNSVGQMVYITAVNGNQLTLQQPLRINYDDSLNVRIRKIVPVSNVGIECMRITRVDNPPSGQGYNIHFGYAVNCWVSGVESDTSVAAHILAEYSGHLTIKGSYFHHAFVYDGVATHGYGICLRQHTSDVLVENNVFKHLRHSMMVKEGANGNVFTYNYSTDPNRSEPISNYSADICMHGDFAYSNLFEGNIVQNIEIDSTWGPSGPFNTLFRNRAELFGLIMTSTAEVPTDSMNIIGTVITDTGAFMGNYIVVGNGHLLYNNNVHQTICPAGTNELTDSSYFYTSKPYFWNINSAWPLGSDTMIPAEQRFLDSTGLTICADNPVITDTSQVDTTAGITNHSDGYALNVYPNPFEDLVNISILSPNPDKADVVLMDVTGKILSAYQWAIQAGKNDFQLNTGELAQGVYMLRIVAKNETSTKKLVRN